MGVANGESLDIYFGEKANGNLFFPHTAPPSSASLDMNDAVP